MKEERINIIFLKNNYLKYCKYKPHFKTLSNSTHDLLNILRATSSYCIYLRWALLLAGTSSAGDPAVGGGRYLQLTTVFPSLTSILAAVQIHIILY